MSGGQAFLVLAFDEASDVRFVEFPRWQYRGKRGADTIAPSDSEGDVRSLENRSINQRHRYGIANDDVLNDVS